MASTSASPASCSPSRGSSSVNTVTIRSASRAPTAIRRSAPPQVVIHHRSLRARPSAHPRNHSSLGNLLGCPSEACWAGSTVGTKGRWTTYGPSPTQNRSSFLTEIQVGSLEAHRTRRPGRPRGILLRLDRRTHHGGRGRAVGVGSGTSLLLPAVDEGRQHRDKPWRRPALPSAVRGERRTPNCLVDRIAKRSVRFMTSDLRAVLPSRVTIERLRRECPCHRTTR